MEFLRIKKSRLLNDSPKRRERKKRGRKIGENKNKYLTGFTLLNNNATVDCSDCGWFQKKFGEDKNRYLTGFTLVEMITAVAIFSTVMIVAMGALLSVLNANKQMQATQTAVNNLSLAVEMMSREIRTGYTYHCGSAGVLTQTQDCSTGENFIAFEPYNGSSAFSGDQVIFKLENNQIKKSTDGGSDFLSLTSPELVVENLRFYVVGSDITDDLQPKVLITANGYVDKGSIGDKGKSYFNLQTTVSQRLVDF